MSILNIHPVRRESAKLVLGLAATSGEGKTYTALLMALGLAGGDPGKVGLLDTENRRGSLYSDIFNEPFLIGDLIPPFSPLRYTEAMREFAEQGIECLVVDSMSHEWEGEGGCEEIAHAKSGKMPDWITSKREHKRFMNTLLFLPCHVICCFRAREKADFKSQPGKVIPMGLQPITEKNVLFEMSTSFLLHNQGRVHDEIKLPECLRPILGHDGYFGTEDGRKLREWVGGKDPVENARNILRLAASEGSARLKSAWETIEKPLQRNLATFKDTLKDLAAHADAEKVAIVADDGAPDDE